MVKKKNRESWTDRLHCGLEAALADRWDQAEIARQVGCSPQALWTFRAQQRGIGYEYRRELERWLTDHGYYPHTEAKKGA